MGRGGPYTPVPRKDRGLMNLVRRSTLLWPGLPWLWLRGSRAGLLVAVAFAIVLDTAIVSTWVWTDLVDAEVAIGLWAAAAAVWLLGTVSALSAFPPPLQLTQDAATEKMFVEARDAYLAHDWLTAETKLLALLTLRPIDGEAQLLLASLLRRVGRTQEAKKALAKLARSDTGLRWHSAVLREQKLLEQAIDEPPSGSALPLSSDTSRPTTSGQQAAETPTGPAASPRSNVRSAA
jgi:hypothetical protein